MQNFSNSSHTTRLYKVRPKAPADMFHSVYPQRVDVERLDERVDPFMQKPDNPWVLSVQIRHLARNPAFYQYSSLLQPKTDAHTAQARAGLPSPTWARNMGGSLSPGRMGRYKLLVPIDSGVLLRHGWRPEVRIENRPCHNPNDPPHRPSDTSLWRVMPPRGLLDLVPFQSGYLFLPRQLRQDVLYLLVISVAQYPVVSKCGFTS